MHRGIHRAPGKRHSKYLIMLLVVGMFVALAVPAGAAPAEKVDVCHVTASSDITNGLNIPSRTWTWGVIVSVPAPAVEAHLAHGDSLTFYTDGLVPGWEQLHEAAIRDDLTINSQVACVFEVFQPEVITVTSDNLNFSCLLYTSPSP